MFYAAMRNDIRIEFSIDVFRPHGGSRLSALRKQVQPLNVYWLSGAYWADFDVTIANHAILIHGTEL